MSEPKSYLESATNESLTSKVFTDPASILAPRFGAPYARYRDLWARAGGRQELGLGFPLHLDTDLIDACNLRCTFCLEKNESRSQARMPLDLLDQILDEANHHTDYYSLNLGATAETLYDPGYFLEALEVIERRPRPLDFFIHTNALNLTQDVGRAILDSRATWVCASLEGVTDMTYRAMRGVGLERPKSNLLKFLEERSKRGSRLPIMRLSMVVSPHNAHERREFLDFWGPRVDLVEFQDLQTTPDMAATLAVSPKHSNCTDPWRRLLVGVDGSVYPCCSFPMFRDPIRLGHARDGIGSIWTGARLASLRRSLASGDYTGCPSCRACAASRFKPDEDENKDAS